MVGDWVAHTLNILVNNFGIGLSTFDKTPSQFPYILNSTVSKEPKEEPLGTLKGNSSYVYSVRRLIPNRDSSYLTTEASRIPKKASNDGGIPFSEEDTGLTTCYKMGWLHRTSQEGFDVCVFPSPLHAKYSGP